MRSPGAAFPAAKLLILLVLGAFSQISSSAAATRCPSGQILRVSLGTCVPKAENLAILARYGTRKHKPAEAEEDAPRPPAAKPIEDKAAKPARADPRPVETAQRDAPAAVEQPSSQPEASSASSLLSPFGALFVGAFHSTVSTGMSAFR
jgi:hypothetical protein